MQQFSRLFPLFQEPAVAPQLAPAPVSNTSSRSGSRPGSRNSGLDSLALLTGMPTQAQQQQQQHQQSQLQSSSGERRSPKASPSPLAGAAPTQGTVFGFGDTAAAPVPLAPQSAGFVNLGPMGAVPSPAVRTESGDSFFKFNSPANLPPRDDSHKNM